MTQRYCPYCDKEIDSFSSVIAHCEKFGASFYNVPCLKCGKKMRVYAKRVVLISKPQKLIEEELNDKETA